LNEALAVLNDHGTETAVVAGGTDLMISARNGTLTSTRMLDVSHLAELRIVEQLNGYVSLGPAVTYSEIISSPLLAEHVPVLVAAARCVGSAQIRNVGTVGGNVANASPAADSVPALLVHHTRVLIQSATSDRIEHLENLITGPYQTNLRPDELITRFLLEPQASGFRHGFRRIARRRALSVARINAAAIGGIDADAAVLDLKLAVGSVTPQPCRMTAAESHVRGKIPDEALIREAAEMVSQEIFRRAGPRPSTEFKRPAVEGLVTEVLNEALLGVRYE